ncbi:hypothetical protein NK718_10845 [Alsobacter sp. SYSU M60028]|uniref:Glycosyltransferase family 8 protein n=1 Tax=Alsobacter ponti TaxID=2962936 RepID=A0ABT1LBZ5_9HYPH|nr:glycosyltransferase [Alsobacter ponti]MCP8939014.1 hypothetical protein [Alsobacter ponti]
MATPLAVCLTPDANYFRPAVVTAASILRQDDSDGLEIVILCDESDVAPGFDRLDPALRSRIEVRHVDWDRYVAGLPVRGHFTSAVNRRLALHRVLPERHQRYVSIDADMMVKRPGLARLADIDLGGFPFAAAMDMIFLKDFEDGPLTAEFQAYRARLGLSRGTPYFNNGLTLVDRHMWEKLDVPRAATTFLAANAGRCAFLEQSALNAVVQGQFAKLSPRYNFMGDFLLLDLEALVEPIVQHFVNRPKPWEPGWRGDPRFARDYREAFAATPWPELAPAPAAGATGAPQPADSDLAAFRRRLVAYLSTVRFADGWRCAPA